MSPISLSSIHLTPNPPTPRPTTHIEASFRIGGMSHGCVTVYLFLFYGHPAGGTAVSIVRQTRVLRAISGSVWLSNDQTTTERRSRSDSATVITQHQSYHSSASHTMGRLRVRDMIRIDKNTNS